MRVSLKIFHISIFAERQDANETCRNSDSVKVSELSTDGTNLVLKIYNDQI